MESGKSGIMTEPAKKQENEIKIYLDEISVMAKYASEQGKNLAKDGFSAKIEKCITAREGFQNFGKDDRNSAINFQEIIEVHSQLSKIIRPVTFVSLDATKPGFLNINQTMKLVIFSTSISLILLIFSLFINENISNTTYFFELFKYLKIFLAAWLGAGVYCLWTARRYLIERTYDPRYNPTYIMRLILGIALGTILGLFGDQFLKQEPEIGRLSQTVLAIIGGFSSDAVAAFLARLAETLRAFVVGSNKDEIKAETDKAINKEKNNAASILLEVKSKLSQGPLTEDQKKSLLNNIDYYLND
jgi:uncharacterized membrane protein YeaQ/YmgE (transglycosylase-associated protein family)